MPEPYSIQELIEQGEEITSDEEDLWYLQRVERGLFTLQTVDYILAWIAMEDDGVSFLLFILSHAEPERSDPRPSTTNAASQESIPAKYRKDAAFIS